MKKRRFLLGLLIMVFLLCGTILALAATQNGQELNTSDGSEVYLHTGSPLIMSNGEVEMLDSDNPDIGATVIEGRTLLPLRAISEYFGAEVSYDKTKKEAVIKYDEKQYFFPIGSKRYFVESDEQRREYSMDSQSIILEGRTMVPLRVICERILEKKVSYYDRVIAVADRELDLESNTGMTAEIKLKIGEAVKARTLKELENLLKTGGKEVYYAWETIDSIGVTKNATPNSSEQRTAANEGLDPAAESQSDSGASSYSTTNVQVEGIDEADVVKTDGKYIYIGGNNVVRIVGTDKGELSDETAIRLSTDRNVREIYVDGGRLVILGTRSVYEEIKTPVQPVLVDKNIEIMPPYIPSKTYSFADVYDISNPLKPILLKGHEMEGNYQSSRKNGDIVYMVTNTYHYGGIVLPMMSDSTVSSKAFTMGLSDIMIMPNHPCPGYLVISAINVKNQEKTEVEAITAYGSTMYMNDSALYLAFNSTDGETSIIKFDLQGMKVGYAGSGKVPGQLLNQFSMDEYKGNLRVATTEWVKSSNSLYILNPSLNIIGSVENLAKGESIYSVRFIGDKGYVVTFRTIDPLFVFDLSNPEKPILTGELEIPGFSSYLHPIGENLLLGLGADTYDIYRKDNGGKDIVIGTRQGGIKFSLFDISDMGKPREVAKYVIGDSGSSSEALYNHKAIMIDNANQNIAIDAYLSFDNEKGSRQAAVIMNYTGDKLTLKGVLNSEPSGVYGNDIPYARRILYIGDVLYYVQDGRIDSYGNESLRKIDSLVLQ